MRVQSSSDVICITRVPQDMAAKTGRVEDVEKVQVDGLVSIRWLGMLYPDV